MCRWDKLPSNGIVLNARQIASVVAMLLHIVRGIPIDNGVTKTEVTCTQNAITVTFGTQNPFTGRIFVKGMSDKEDCIQSFADGGSTQGPEIAFDFGKCNMQRTRTLTPQRGMMQSIVVIISFHRMFITKVDKAYKVQCFYMEAEKTVTASLDVSMITTDDIQDTGRMPTCTYTVRKGATNGEIVQYARVGDKVFHTWLCDSDSHRILIKNCYVDDGQGNKFETLDERGCAIDPVIMADLKYDNDGMARAYVESHVFKFADRPTLSFQCTVQICNKGENNCDAISPPNCSSRRRFSPPSTGTSFTNVAPSSFIPPSPQAVDSPTPLEALETSRTVRNSNEAEQQSQPTFGSETEATVQELVNTTPDPQDFAQLEDFETIDSHPTRHPVSDFEASIRNSRKETKQLNATVSFAPTDTSDTMTSESFILREKRTTFGNGTDFGPTQPLASIDLQLDTVESSKLGVPPGQFVPTAHNAPAAVEDREIEIRQLRFPASDDPARPVPLEPTPQNDPPLPGHLNPRGRTAEAAGGGFAGFPIGSQTAVDGQLDDAIELTEPQGPDRRAADVIQMAMGTNSQSENLRFMPSVVQGSERLHDFADVADSKVYVFGAPQRSKRDVDVIQETGSLRVLPEALRSDELDIVSNNIAVMDLDEALGEFNSGGYQYDPELFNTYPTGEVVRVNQGICMSPIGFGLLVSLVLVVILVVLMVACLLCYGKRKRKTLKASLTNAFSAR